MQEVITTSNVCGINGYLDSEGKVWLNAEDVARGWGFVKTETKNGKVYESIRWATLNGYLKEFDFRQLVGENDFLPENIVYRLGFKAKNEKAIAFQEKLANEILPSIRKTGSYSIDKNTSNKTQMQIASEEMEYTVKFAKSLEDFGVEKGIAQIHALKIGKNFYTAITDVTINDITALLPPTEENNVAYLTPTKIAEEINNRNLFDILIKAKSVNKALENLGYQTKENKGWKITDKAEELANMFPYENNKHTGYQIRWKYEIIDVLIEYFNDLY